MRNSAWEELKTQTLEYDVIFQDEIHGNRKEGLVTRSGVCKVV